MVRRFPPVLPVVAVLLFALAGSPLTAKPGDPVAGAAAKARAGFASGLHDAEAILASATTNLTVSLAAKTKTPEAAANGYGVAFVFFAGTVKKLGDEAAAAFAKDASQASAQANDATLRGTLSGDGGAIDKFAEDMQSAIDAARKRAVGRARKFAKSLAAAGTTRVHMNVSAPPWTFERRAAPAIPTAIVPADDTIRLYAAVATRLDDGKVVVSLGGRAPRSVSGDFDVRLVAGATVNVVGAALSAGGLTVSLDGNWSVTATVSDPMQGQSFASGNRVIEFGVEPFDGGLAGRQPGRFVQGGVIGVQ